jgi:hypothetical protein
MKQIKITEIEVTPEVAAALCPDGEPSAECISRDLSDARTARWTCPRMGILSCSE